MEDSLHLKGGNGVKHLELTIEVCSTAAGLVNLHLDWPESFARAAVSQKVYIVHTIIKAIGHYAHAISDVDASSFEELKLPSEPGFIVLTIPFETYDTKASPSVRFVNWPMLNELQQKFILSACVTYFTKLGVGLVETAERQHNG